MTRLRNAILLAAFTFVGCQDAKHLLDIVTTQECCCSPVEGDDSKSYWTTKDQCQDPSWICAFPGSSPDDFVKKCPPKRTSSPSPSPTPGLGEVRLVALQEGGGAFPTTCFAV